ncbi:putative dehydrogenase [Roseimicrobium gellanilyticum]|uniref:Putative dehydrogenase n=1 Tax=Roseimicrobium gellanilyticum TaxID=748857 RepID=A0A366H9N8_9BACT|nr:Gfo/Idh/MocA family oxidoreductase [Roseimicrobium gellanilyticum]RBP38990.1 putative dehydrogenase [Roseimicrobium gellanilyticum]
MAHSSGSLLRILVVGCGSIGERHLRCFQTTGRCEVEACDANHTLLQTVEERYGVKTQPDLNAALQSNRYDALIICTPAHTHLPIARLGAVHGAALLIEKPLSTSLDGVEETRCALERSGKHVAVAYVYHAFPWIREAQAHVKSGTLGRMLHATMQAGQHFPTFRPAYRDIYYAKREMGGGCIQDAITHAMNAMEWMLGPATRVFTDASHQMLEGVTVEDTVNLSVRHEDILASYAMNQFQTPNELSILLHGELGSLSIEHHRQRWGTMMRGETEWTWRVTPPLQRDDLFIAQANAFLDGMEGKPSPLCTFDEGVQTLKFNLAALRSMDSGLPVTIS